MRKLPEFDHNIDNIDDIEVPKFIRLELMEKNDLCFF